MVLLVKPEVSMPPVSIQNKRDFIPEIIKVINEFKYFNIKSKPQAEMSNVSPRTQMMNDVVAKHPHISISRACYVQSGGPGSPPLKRKRSSSLSSPDIRRKVLESKLSSSVIIQEHLKSHKKVFGGQKSIFSVSSSSNSLDCSLEENNEECFEEDEKSVIELVDNSIIELVDQSIDLAEGSLVKETAPCPSKDVQKSPIKVQVPSPSIPKQVLASPASENLLTPTKSQKASPESHLKDPSPRKEVQWVEVKRSKRKLRIYFIEAKSEDEGFKAVYKAGEKFPIPSCVNGRKPFSIVPGIDYNLEVDVEEVGEALAENDDKELKLIQNENYLLDSFCCDTGYLSDEELNETPNPNKIVSKVKQQRRANNIKDKRKFEKLTDPQILGPFWWTGKAGCKKELKKWQPMLFVDTPISTGFTTSSPEDLNIEEYSGEEQDIDFISKPERKEPPPVDSSESSTSLAAPPAIASTGEAVTVDHFEKYNIKYLVKFVVEKIMKDVSRKDEDEDVPIESSTPMPKRPNVRITLVS